MAIISQVLPCLYGGLAGGLFNSIGGVAREVSKVAVPTFRQGVIFGALGGMASKIIYSRTEQIKKTYFKDTDDPLVLIGTHVTAYVMMLLSWHAARYVANNYLDLEISKKTIVMMSAMGVIFMAPVVGLWTLTSLPDGGNPRGFFDEF